MLYITYLEKSIFLVNMKVFCSYILHRFGRLMLNVNGRLKKKIIFFLQNILIREIFKLGLYTIIAF